MTVLTTVVGLLPMALAFGVGTEANQPLAIAVIDWLLVSTSFTLILIPTLYVMLEERFPRTIREAEDSSCAATSVISRRALSTLLSPLGIVRPLIARKGGAMEPFRRRFLTTAA